MSVRIGGSPIGWQNDDLPDFTAAFHTDVAMKNAPRRIRAERSDTVRGGSRQLRSATWMADRRGRSFASTGPT